ncbi:type II toxin-antitoxin system VapC family toxin [Variovorax saccharolyticus]|uniref:type II toxin-antitoxin system VapC family toxin n=1 Tax=Variovorax saccharolyticus TaxID=3053516 RepID=UPI002574F892|nr:PIN domain-containing protein [Variovorax sp. J31P216]MDM0024630.1 PIN domain-containing protein [Variovorax sp. J31P216]
MTTGSTTEGTSQLATTTTQAATGYMLDTNVFNRVVEGEFAREDLPPDAELFVTHQQVAELANTPDSHKEKRIQMMLALLAWRPILVPTAMVWDASRWGHSAWSDADDFAALRSALDGLNKCKPNNVADCLIAEAAFSHGHTLVTTDGDLAATLQAHGGLVVKLK